MGQLSADASATIALTALSYAAVDESEESALVDQGHDSETIAETAAPDSP